MPDVAAPFTHRGTRAVQRMVEHAPSTGGLALWVHHRELPVHTLATGPVQAPIVTDGSTLFYTAGFDSLSLPQQAGCVAHAVLHIALRHAQRYQALRQRTGDADLQLFNVCADAIVNTALAHLGWLRMPPDAVRLERLLSTTLGLQLDTEGALLAWDVERLYRAVDDRRDRRDRASGRNRAALSSEAHRPSDGARAIAVRALARADTADLMPGPDTGVAPEDEAEAARDWCERLQRAHAGDGAHSMLRTLLADLPRRRTPWEQALRAQLSHALAQRPGVSWSRPSRSFLANQGRGPAGLRLPWEPGTSASRRVPRLVVVVDVSGSIDDALCGRFASEIEALSRRLESAVVLVIGDDQVQRVETFEPGVSGLRDIAFRGGGGTDFTPLLEEARRHRPDIIVVLTDLQGPVRCRPTCPVIWAVPDAAFDLVPPFGRLLRLD